VLSRDVRAKDLGLLVLDEEQRFGVRQKELLRQLRLRVDVIAMSATPIPRTLQMSLAGLRDISVIETPPEGRRPVRTYVGEYDEQLVRQALEREGERGGQAFYLHNRVETIDEVAARLRALCPKLRFEVAHGQLEEQDLTKLLEYCRTVARAVKWEIPINYPLVGRDAFRTATGVHAAAIIKSMAKGDAWLADRIYSGVPAGMFGRKQEICIGFMSGASNVNYWLAERGIASDDVLVSEVLKAAKGQDSIMTDEQVLEVVKRVRG